MTTRSFLSFAQASAYVKSLDPGNMVTARIMSRGGEFVVESKANIQDRDRENSQRPPPPEEGDTVNKPELSPTKRRTGTWTLEERHWAADVWSGQQSASKHLLIKRLAEDTGRSPLGIVIHLYQEGRISVAEGDDLCRELGTYGLLSETNIVKRGVDGIKVGQGTKSDSANRSERKKSSDSANAVPMKKPLNALQEIAKHGTRKTTPKKFHVKERAGPRPGSQQRAKQLAAQARYDQATILAREVEARRAEEFAGVRIGVLLAALSNETINREGLEELWSFRKRLERDPRILALVSNKLTAEANTPHHIGPPPPIPKKRRNEVCPGCGGDGGAAGACYKCDGTGWI